MLEYASNYRRGRRVIRALTSGGSGLLAGLRVEEWNREERERGRRASGSCLVAFGFRATGKNRGSACGGKTDPQRWRERRSRFPGKKGKTVRGFGTRASRDRQIYGTATSFSRRGGLDLTRSCLDTDFAERSRAPNATRERPSSSVLSLAHTHVPSLATGLFIAQ